MKSAKSAGKTEGLRHHGIDKAAQETARQLPEESIEIFRVVANNATTGLFVMDDKQHCTFMNPAAEDITGYTFQEVQAFDKPLHDIIHYKRPDGSPYPIHDCPIDSALPQKNRIPGEDIFIKPDGSYYPVAFMASPIIKNNQPVGTIIELRDITAQKNADKELRELISVTEQRNALLKINTTKDEFIGLASHQLRTPATAVKQYVGIVLDGLAGSLNDEQRQYLQTAYDSNERELAIVNDLLKTAQIDSNKYTIRKIEHDLNDILNDCIKDMELTYSARNQKLTFNTTSKKVLAPVDETEIKLVFMNLLENASKYSYPDSEITVDIERSLKQAVITISDKGVGISIENQQRIFDKFTRVNNELSDTVAGSGLGLYWVKQIVELHKGSIKLTSSLGEGSTFTIRLPL